MDQEQYLDVVLKGSSLTRLEVEELEQRVRKTPSNLTDRLKLIGYLSKHYYCCEDSSAKRACHIIWLIDYTPDFTDDISPFLYVHLLDRSGYRVIRDSWEQARRKHPGSFRVLVNMAAFVRAHEPELAEELYLQALSITPEDPVIEEKLENLRRSKALLIQNRDSFSRDEQEFFQAHAVTCSHDCEP